MFARLRMKLTPYAPILALSLCLAGCGDGGTTAAGAPDDTRQVEDVVDAFNDARQTPKQAEKLFVAGAMPKGSEFKKYAKLSYWPTMGKASVDGETATLKLKVRDETTGNDTGEVDWEFKKEGDGWKIAKAPLP